MASAAMEQTIELRPTIDRLGARTRVAQSIVPRLWELQFHAPKVLSWDCLNQELCTVTRICPGFQILDSCFWKVCEIQNLYQLRLARAFIFDSSFGEVEELLSIASQLIKKEKGNGWQRK